MFRSKGLLFAGLLLFTAGQPLPAQNRIYRLPATDLKQHIIWGATGAGPDGTELSFGGQDQRAEDGRSHTRIRIKGEWQAIHHDLRARNLLQKYHDRCRNLAKQEKDATARARHLYLQGLGADLASKRVKSEVVPLQEEVTRRLAALAGELNDVAAHRKGYDAEQARRSARALGSTLVRARTISVGLAKQLTPGLVDQMHAVQTELEQTAEGLDAEPPPRALSPLVFDARSKRFILFGGDHLDYLTNDTWVFDPSVRKWEQRHPASAPPPRANHVLKAGKDGKIVLSGGYTYTSNTDYMGGQYRDLGDGDWTYDVHADRWTGGKGVRPGTRVYRTGPFLPGYFLQGSKPDTAAFARRLASLPANTWVMTAPPRLPQLNRDWGSAVLDPDRDLILRFSGGHCAHGGSDVLHFHLGSNRWELPFPVEFPLGQLYSNTSYPAGFNFNLRPWVTGHTYQNYGYDPVLHKMLFTGRTRHCYVYDPDVGDWTVRFAKPKGMAYDSCFYTLTLCPTPAGLVAWTQAGELFRFNAARRAWLKLEQLGDRLPGSVVDNSTVVHDSKRNRLLFARKGYETKSPYDGQLYTYDLASGKVGKLSPRGMTSAGIIPYLCQIRYDSHNDLLLVGATLPSDRDGVRRTPAYDCANNCWLSLRIGGDDPSGKAGRNVSLGMVYDARRKLFWAVDTHSRVFVLRLDPRTADSKPLE